MVTVRIMNEFMHGPIWICEYGTGIELGSGFSLVSDDPLIRDLDAKAEELYSSYFEFDSHGQACWFDEERERANRLQMLELLDGLLSRLDEINDGSFEVVDFETERLRSL